jgi:hypothetical protein
LEKAVRRCTLLLHGKCEKRFKKVADSYTGLFEDMLNIFLGSNLKNSLQYHSASV